MCLCLILLSGSLAVQASAAHGAQPASNALEQDWELLAETGSYNSSKTLDIRRGDLPGGTTKFEPAPAATLEVVGKHTGGSGASKWEVALMATSTEVLASVEFLTTDGTLSIKTAAISWPSVDEPLRSLRLTKINDGLNFAGNLVIQKAYLKIRQTGVIKKTVGRVPLATKQTSIMNTDWQDLTDVAYYKHRPASFDPAPTILLRTTGIETTANPVIQTLHVRLVDSTGSVVAGSENQHAALGNLSTGALALTGGAIYKIQAKVTIFPQSGDLYSADLVLEQSSSSVDGLKRTVAWYPSVTAATNLAADGVDLGYLFNAPENSVPERARTWTYSARRLTGTGTLGVELRDTNAASTLASGLVSTADFTFSGVPVTSDPDAGNDIDSRSTVAAGSSGRVSSSALRIAMDLQSGSVPIIFGLAASLAAISPNGDGVKDATVVSAIIDDVTLTSWTLAIKDMSGAAVRTFTGSSASMSVGWDGKNGAGAVVPDGDYTASLIAVDSVGNSATASRSIRIDTTAPSIDFLTPSNESNAAFATSPFAAQVLDPDGPVASSIAFTLTDHLAGQVTQLAAAAYDPSSGWATTLDHAFTAGRSYGLSVYAADELGNGGEVTQPGGFTAINASTASVSARIPASTCSLSTPAPGATVRIATCATGHLDLDAGTATLSGSRHSGVGVVRHIVALSGAVVRSGAGEIEPAYDAADPAWAPRTAIARFAVRTATTSPATYATEGPSLSLGVVATEVPSSWGSASLEMPGTPTQASPDICADPSSSEITCTPDPVKTLSPLGSELASNDLRGAVGARPTGGDGRGVSVPLLSAAPTWFTPAWVEENCDSPVPVPAAEGAPAPSFDGIRPGGWMVNGCSDVSAVPKISCTFNWLFRKPGPVPGGYRFAIGTAGHCVGGNLNFSVSAFARDPSDGVPKVILDLGKSIVGLDAGFGSDFALIEIHEAYYSWLRPATALVGGPSGPFTGDPTMQPVQHVGHGSVIGTGGTPRVGTVHHWNQKAGFAAWVGAAAPGDSGSPVQTLDKQSLAVLTHGCIWLHASGGYVSPDCESHIPANPGTDTGIYQVMAGTTYARVMQIMVQQGQTGWTLWAEGS